MIRKADIYLFLGLSMTIGSIRDVMVSMSEKSGKPIAGILEETIIATLLRDVLKGLEYFHNNNQIHRLETTFNQIRPLLIVLM